MRSGIGQDLLLIHAAGQILQHVLHRDTQPTDGRLPATLAGLDGDDVMVVYN